MKIVKYIFLLLLLGAIAITVFIATQDGRYDIAEKRIIKIPKNVIYNYINDYRNWENVSIIPEIDSTTVLNYTENSAGKDASVSWNTNGNGKIETIDVKENDSIIQSAEINGRNSNITWAFKDTLNATKVTLRITGKMTFTDKAWAVIKGESEKKIKTHFEKGLNDLSNFLTNELSNYNIKASGIQTKPGTYYLGYSTTTKISGLRKKVSETLPRLINFIKENKITVNGAPFLLYKTFDTIQGKTSYSICVPIKEEIFTATESEFEGGKLESFTAVKTTLQGDYSHLKSAWDTAHNYFTEKNIQENKNGAYLEVYTKGINQTPKPSQWITDIYIPVYSKEKDTIPAPAPALSRTIEPVN